MSARRWPEMARDYDWDLFDLEDEQVEIHHQDCTFAPDEPNTGDANSEGVTDAQHRDEYDTSCRCLDPLLGKERRQTTYKCERCGAEYTVPGEDPFTTITVSYHDDDREDFAESFCQDCGDELLESIVAAAAREDWDPSPGQLRDGETPDESAHVRRNAAQLAMGDDMEVTDGDE
jgi:DNA-directed RNA polymerase subunit RPC12/RpoP